MSLLNISSYRSMLKIFVYVGCLNVIVVPSINYVFVVHRSIREASVHSVFFNLTTLDITS